MAQMTPEMAYDLYTVRGLLEGLAASLATERITRQNLKRMGSILNKQEKAVKQGNLLEYSNSDFAFHAVIYEACGNWLLKEQLENIKRRSRPFVCDIGPVLKDLYQDHLNVVTAFRQKDTQAAKEIMKAHNRRMQDQIEMALKNSEQKDSDAL